MALEVWIIGSAQTGLGCFTCITGQIDPDHDYEIDVADGVWPMSGSGQDQTLAN